MKNIFIFILFLLLFIFSSPSKADILALESKSIKHYGIGVLNMPDEYNIYEYPDKTSNILLKVNHEKIRNSAIIKSSKKNLVSYITYIPSENIALLTVDTDDETGWYSVCFNQSTGETGWVFIDNKDAFLTYKSLFYKYGKKYGVRLFNDLPEDTKVLYSKQSNNSKKLEQLSFPRFINFTVIRGNWMLVTVSNIDNQAKIGWFNWRNDDGSLNMFPNFK